MHIQNTLILEMFILPILISVLELLQFLLFEDIFEVPMAVSGIGKMPVTALTL